MNRFALSINPWSSHSPRRGYTLIEILIATMLSMMMLGAVVYLFGTVGTSITQSRAILESAERLRNAQNRLQQDLEGLTATPMPTRKPEFNEGVFEYIEGPITQGQNGPIVPSGIIIPVDTDKGASLDTTVGDFDDILMFTTRAQGKPFLGRYFDPLSNAVRMIESDVAEVAWFVRGRDLHRRVLLVAPHLPLSPMTPFYEHNDISVRLQGGNLVPNTLGDLTRRECRYAHFDLIGGGDVFPYDARRWGQLGLPTLRESACQACSPGNFMQLYSRKTSLTLPNTTDFWTSNPTMRLADNILVPTPADDTSARIADDVILTNVIGFDVKAWDQGANGGLGAYVDLGGTGAVNLLTQDTVSSGLPINAATPQRVYDTWSTTYDAAPASDGFDHPTQGLGGIVDDAGERAAAPPFPVPLRGVQIKIRIFEPDSRQIREVTIQQDFLPK